MDIKLLKERFAQNREFWFEVDGIQYLCEIPRNVDMTRYFKSFEVSSDVAMFDITRTHVKDWRGINNGDAPAAFDPELFEAMIADDSKLLTRLSGEITKRFLERRKTIEASLKNS